MKRSQMEKALYRKLKQWDNCKIRIKEVRELLNFIEAKGMLPPTVPTLIIGRMVQRSENKWEPED